MSMLFLTRKSKKSLFIANCLNDDGEIDLYHTILWDRVYEDLSCPHCSQTFSDHRDVIWHTLCEHIIRGIQMNEHYCMYCNFITGSEGRLRIHIENQHRRDIVPLYRCVIQDCLTFTPDKEPMVDHIKKVHANHIFICDEMECVSAFCSKSLLDRHYGSEHQNIFVNRHFEQLSTSVREGTSRSETFIRETVHQITERTRCMLACEFCGHWSNSGLAFRKHKASVHTEKMKFTCEECGEKFSERKKLTRHFYKCQMLRANKMEQYIFLSRIMSLEVDRQVIYDMKVVNEKIDLIKRELRAPRNVRAEKRGSKSIYDESSDISDLSPTKEHDYSRKRKTDANRSIEVLPEISERPHNLRSSSVRSSSGNLITSLTEPKLYSSTPIREVDSEEASSNSSSNSEWYELSDS